MSPPSPIRVLIVDDNDDLAGMLALLFGHEPDIFCVGRIPSADTLLATIERETPAVVILDLTMPGLCPMDAMAESCERFPDTRFVVLSGYDDQARVDEAVARGAWGFVAKDGDVNRVTAAVRAVSMGQVFLKTGDA